MSKGYDPKRRYRRLMIDAWLAFQGHLISREIGPGHWLLQRPWKGKPGGWEWNMAAEIVVLQGKLLVSGDLYPVIFAYYGPYEDLSLTVDWMGKCRDFGYYVYQKATIGLREVVEEYESDVALFELDKMREKRIAEIKEEMGEDIDPTEAIETDEVVIGLEEAKNVAYQSHESLVEFLQDNLCDYYDIEAFCDIGKVIAPRVFYAYAAVARLSRLLDLER